MIQIHTHQSDGPGASKEFVSQSQSSLICGHLALAALALGTMGKWMEESQVLAWCASGNQTFQIIRGLATDWRWLKYNAAKTTHKKYQKSPTTRGVFARLFESWLGCKKSFPKPCGCCTLTWGVVLLGPKVTKTRHKAFGSILICLWAEVKFKLPWVIATLTVMVLGGVLLVRLDVKESWQYECWPVGLYQHGEAPCLCSPTICGEWPHCCRLGRWVDSCAQHLVQQQTSLEPAGTPKEGMSYFFSLGDFGVAACEKAYKASWILGPLKLGYSWVPMVYQCSSFPHFGISWNRATPKPSICGFPYFYQPSKTNGIAPLNPSESSYFPCESGW